MVKHFPSDFLVLFSSFAMFLRCVSPKKKRLTLCFIVVRPQEATDGILGFKDGWYSPCGSAWWLVVATNPSEKYANVKLENFPPIFRGES